MRDCVRLFLMGLLALARPASAADGAPPAALYTAIGKYEPAPAGKGGKPLAADAALAARYAQAVKDAAVAEPAEISKNLSAINPANTRLVRRLDRETTLVLTVTWTGWTGYNGLAGTTTTLTRDVWITLAPELREFMAAQGVEPTSRTLRAEQALGLPPGNGKTWFVEMWADPDDLFRPSPDPEISDYEASLDIPRSTRFVTVNPAHLAWIETLKGTSYGANGYPWTRLGYTYDWGNPQSEIGLSEYVIRAGAVVRIHAATATDAYLAPETAAAAGWVRYP